MNNKHKEKLYLLFEKLKSDKKSLIIIFIGIVGMLLIAFSEFTNEDTPNEIYENESYTFNQEQQKKELESLIGEITGAGRVKVMITYECSQESVFAQNISEQKDESSNETVNEYIIVDEGSTEEGLLVKEVFPKVMGVAVVCDGGNNPTVKNEITMMIKAIFNISSNNISITEMQK